MSTRATGKQTPITMSFDDKGQFRVQQRDTLEVTGTYTWKFENGVLSLVKLTDKCADRVKSLVGVMWQRQN